MMHDRVRGMTRFKLVVPVPDVPTSGPPTSPARGILIATAMAGAFYGALGLIVWVLS